MSVTQPRRLSGYTEKRGARTGFSLAGALLFGFVFVAAGFFIVLVGMRVIPVDPGSVHAPWWVLTTCGAVFAAGGLFVWGMAVTRQKDERHRRAAARRSSDPALQDHAWDTRGYTPPRWKRAMGAITGALFFTLFLSIFNWWAWGVPDAPWPVKVIVVVFDLIVLLVWRQAIIQTGRAVKFGGSRLEFDHFPYRMTESISLRWIPPRALKRADKGTFTFRCVREYYEERGSGKSRNRSLVHDELGAETQSFATPQALPRGRPLEFRFALPFGAIPTRLNDDAPVYWEFEARLSMPGFDFEERYLVPVYE